MSKLLEIKLKLVFFILIPMMIVSSCNYENNSHILVEGTYPIAEVFTNFYERIGGEEILGPAISGVFNRDQVTYQYTVNALMVFDPNAVNSQRYQLASIALEWGIEEPPEKTSENTRTPYINGHQVWEEIQPFYEDLGGYLIGLPLTGVRFNSVKNRYEQYYTNLGFYRNVSDEPGSVHLIPYGDWFCASECLYEIQDTILINSPKSLNISEMEQVFLDRARSLGEDFTGQTLSKTRIAADGNYEVVFENIVFYAKPNDPINVMLRPLPQLIGIIQESPVPPRMDPGVYFYEVQDGFGYNVPQNFLDFITLHGGMELSGSPITELHPTSEGTYRQCFTNYCLTCPSQEHAAKQIHVTPYGNIYIEKMPLPLPSVNEVNLTMNIQIQEHFPLIPSGQSQEIEITVSDNGFPVFGIEPSLRIRLPDGNERSYLLPPTGAGGKTMIILDPINAPNGTSILYESCAAYDLYQPVCSQGMFLVWESP